MSILIDDSEPS